MMRVFRAAACAALLAGIPSIVQAQGNKPFGLGISAGASMPSGDLGNSVDVGYNVTGHLYIHRANKDSRLQFRVNVSYDSWKWKKDTDVDATTRSFGGSLEAVVYLAARDASVRPYLVGGGGMYNYKTKVNSVVGETAETGQTKPGVQGGGGLEFNLSGFSTFVEAKFINVFPDNGNVRWIPISFGIHL